MPVTNSYIGLDQTQKDGSRSVHEYHELSNGETIRFAYKADAGFDTNARIVSRVAEVDVQLIDSETRSFKGDPLTATFFDTDKRKVIRRMLLEAYQDENPKALLKLKPLITWLRANYTGVQIATYLRVTTTQLSRLATRFDDLALVESTINADTAEEIS